MLLSALLQPSWNLAPQACLPGSSHLDLTAASEFWFQMCLSPKALSPALCFVTIQALCGWPNLNERPYPSLGMLTPESPRPVKEQCVFYSEATFRGHPFPPHSKSWTEFIIFIPPQVYSSHLHRRHHPGTQARNLDVVWDVSFSSMLMCKQSPRREILRKQCKQRSYMSHPRNACYLPFSIWFTTAVQFLHLLLSNGQPTNYSCLLRILYLLPTAFQLRPQCFSHPSHGPSEYGPPIVFTPTSCPSR